MEDLENGLPPNDVDLSGKGISQMTYAVADHQEKWGVSSINYAAQEYNEVQEKSKISSIAYSTANIEGINFMTYT